MTLPQVSSALVGAIIMCVSVWAFCGHPARRFKALFWLAIGVAMIYAGFRPHVIEYLGADSLELRLRLVVALLSFMVLTVTLEAIRIGRMQERYAFLWLVTGMILLLGALFQELSMVIPRFTGISFGATIVLILFAFVMLLLFHLSVALSVLQMKVFQLTREVALAEERLRRLEQDTEKKTSAPRESDR